jgi:outer membrane protein
MKIGKARMILIAGAVIVSLTSLAPAAGAAEFSVGAGLGVAPDYEGSQDFAPGVVPFVNAVWSNNLSFNLLGAKAKANLIPSPMWKGGVVGEYIPERADVDSSAVDNMQDVDASFMVGGFVGFDVEGWSASIEAMKDATNGNDGSILRLNGGYRLPVDQRLSLIFGVFATWADDDYMDAYFSVSAADAMRSGLRMYDADAGLKDMGASVTVTYKMAETWGLKGLASYKALVNDAADSPVVDNEGDANQFAASILAYFTF